MAGAPRQAARQPRRAAPGRGRHQDRRAPHPASRSAGPALQGPAGEAQARGPVAAPGRGRAGAAPRTSFSMSSSARGSLWLSRGMGRVSKE